MKNKKSKKSKKKFNKKGSSKRGRNSNTINNTNIPDTIFVKLSNEDELKNIFQDLPLAFHNYWERNKNEYNERLITYSESIEDLISEIHDNIMYDFTDYGLDIENKEVHEQTLAILKIIIQHWYDTSNDVIKSKIEQQTYIK